MSFLPLAVSSTLVSFLWPRRGPRQRAAAAAVPGRGGAHMPALRRSCCSRAPARPWRNRSSGACPRGRANRLLARAGEAVAERLFARPHEATAELLLSRAGEAVAERLLACAREATAELLEVVRRPQALAALADEDRVAARGRRPR